MDILNLSMDDNEADTSQDELEEFEGTTDVLSQVTQVVRSGLGSAGGDPNDKEQPDSKVPEENVEESKFLLHDQNNLIILNEFQTWERPKIPEGTMFYSTTVLQEQPDSFQFYMLDCVSTVSQVKHPSIKLHEDVQDLPMHNVIRLFGVAGVPKVAKLDDTIDTGFDSGWNEDEIYEEEDYSASVCCNLHGFLPYFYAAPGVEHEKECKDYWTPEKLQELQDGLNEKLKNEILQDITCVQYHEFVEQHSSKCVIKIEVFDSMESEEAVYHMFKRTLTGTNTGFAVLKITCSLSCFIWKARKILETPSQSLGSFECFEHNINNTIRFLTSVNIPGCSWVQANGGQYFLRQDQGIPPVKESHCQIEIDLHYANLRSLPQDHHRYDRLPTLRVLSFDIEVLVTDSVPRNGINQVIQIGNIVGNYKGGEPSNDQSVVGKVVFALGKCDMITEENVKLLHFYSKEQPANTDEEFLKEAEAAMLATWREFIVRMDPDIITGYNIKKFDTPYLIDRSNILKHTHSIAKLLPNLGRLKALKSTVRPVSNSLKKAHKYDEVAVNIQGRVMMDLFPILVRHDKNSYATGSFKLENVAKRFLKTKEAKLDVHFSAINGLHHGTPSSRKRLAEYCLQDSLIPFLLLFEPAPCHVEKIRLIDLYCRRSLNSGNLLRYLFNKSPSYNDYFKQVRLQKNPGKVVFQPDTPSPKKRRRTYDFWASRSSSPSNAAANRSHIRNIFPN